MPESTLSYRARIWKWFGELARGPHALSWLALAALLDPIFSPLAPEIYLVALMLAHPARWKEYLGVSIAFSTVGAMGGYLVGAFLFEQFGLPILHFYGLEGAYEKAQAIITQQVFWAMIIAAFSPVPEKVTVLAAGALGAPFFPFILGFFVGRSTRIALILYLSRRFGMHLLDLLHKYSMYFLLLLVLVTLYYGIVHFHILPW